MQKAYKASLWRGSVSQPTPIDFEALEQSVQQQLSALTSREAELRQQLSEVQQQLAKLRAVAGALEGKATVDHSKGRRTVRRSHLSKERTELRSQAISLTQKIRHMKEAKAPKAEITKAEKELTEVRAKIAKAKAGG